jgi:hypothetical protein
MTPGLLDPELAGLATGTGLQGGWRGDQEAPIRYRGRPACLGVAGKRHRRNLSGVAAGHASI